MKKYSRQESGSLKKTDTELETDKNLGKKIIIYNNFFFWDCFISTG